MKRILLALMSVLASGWAAAQTSNTWSTQDYDFFAGDFNGDGFTDVLFIAHSPSMPSGILLSDGTAPTILGQTWASNYLGIPWSSDAYSVHVGDFNGDGKTDIFLQPSGPGDSYLLLADSSGHISAISQSVPDHAMGLAWSADQHHLLVGDFNGDGHADLFFQPTLPEGMSAVVYADVNGQFTSKAPAQSWADGYLGFNWSVSDANVYAGDFNGDGRADLLIQAQPTMGVASGNVSFSYPPNMNGVVLAQGDAQPFAMSGVQSWNRNAFGVDWSPLTHNLVIADFNGDGRSDALFQPLTAGAAPSLIFGNATGPIFTTATAKLPADVAVSADSAALIAGKFAGGSAAQLLIQAASRKGNNAIAKNVASGIHPRTVALPTLSSTSVSMAGIGYPTQGAAAPTKTAGTVTPMAGTVTPTSAGRTAAQFSVTPTGAASYNLPMWTPPGARGIEPHLALHYTSGGPDGPMGPGWSLMGLSAIVRCGKTWVSSGGAPAGVTLSTTDDLCLDGNRLRVTSGTQGVAGSTYQTEIADFSLITAYGSQGNGPQYFIVQGKDGRYYEYGNTADSRIFASGTTTPYAWALNKVRDRQNNNMVFTYASGATALTLAKILYTATPGTSNAAPYEVDFNYVTRVGGSTITQSVAGGTVIRTTQLDNVNVLASGTSVRKYQLGYSASGATQRPLLQTVQECGGSAGTDCIRPTTISYQSDSGQVGWITSAYAVGQTVPVQAQTFPMDLNGDGIADLVYPQTGGSGYQWYVRYGTRSGVFGSPVSTGVTTLTTDTLYPGDFAARGHQDLLYPSGGYWWRLYWNGTGLSTASTGVAVDPNSSGYLAGVADVNGDGLPDILWVKDDGGPNTSIQVLLNTTVPGGAVSFRAPSAWYALPKNTYCADVNPCSEYHVAATSWPDRSLIAVADFNNDGKADLLVKVLHRTQSGSTYYWAQLFSTGGGFNSTNIWEFPTSSPDLQLTDWNGDGCTDIIWSDPGTSHWTVILSDCTNSGASTGRIDTGIPSTQNILITDYDGDGRLDILTSTANTNWKVGLSTGTGISALTDTQIPAGANAFFLGDFNGDGLTDLGWIDATASGALEVNFHNAPGTPPDLAKSFSDGFGISFSPTYVPISQYNYTKYSDAVFPEMDFQGPMYVVNQFSASDGTGGTYTNDFAYWGARLNDHDDENHTRTVRADAHRQSHDGLRELPSDGRNRRAERYAPEGHDHLWLRCLRQYQFRFRGRPRPEWRGDARTPYQDQLRVQYCALPEQVTNALNQSTVTAYNYNFGLPSSTTDPNGISTSWQYDNFGRKTKETRPDGTYTTYMYNDCVASSCWGVPDLRFLVYRYEYSSTGTQLRTEEKFYDGLDRQRYEELNRVLGVWDVQIFYYDSLGRKTQATVPYSSSSNGYRIYSYDVANRLTEDDLYDATGAFYRSIKLGYAGQTTTVTDPNSNTITKVTDVAGKIRQVTDPNTNGTVAGTTSYTFDPFGNLITLIDADNISSSYSYNIRGFKTGSNDADAGSWTFTPDSLNELVSQKDAKNQVTTFGYDLLGRMTSRTEPESTTATQWVYGTSAASHNIGRIAQVTKPDGYAEAYTYDSLGRALTVTYTEDSTNYAFTYAYNTLGSLDTLTYPVSTSGYKFVLKNVYDAYGYLNQVKDNAAGTAFWTLNSANDGSLPTLETLGNGAQVATSYTAWTNEVSTRSEGSGGSATNLQNLSYSWDLAGNLRRRIDNRQSLTEQFAYDSMNRLLSSTLNGANNLTMTYDAAGNINTKSDVSSSSYVYDTAHKHAVKTAGSWSMTYDANGNMITRAGGSISYYSYNQPNTINYNGNSTQFFYNASHQRWKQVATYSGVTETTHYIGGLLETMTRGSGPIEYRHQIPAGSGTVVYTRRTDGTTGTYYATSDHLGSSDLVMDSAANVLTRQSFTPFGARRGSAWTGAPSSADYTSFGNTTRKGFTGHEMLDSVGLVHMNGRVNDPYLGRFLSADTVVQSLGATESVNPYA